MEIRTAVPADVDAVTALEAVCFPPAEAAPRSAIATRLAAFPHTFWLLWEGDDLLAMVNGMTACQKDLTDEMYAGDSLYDPEGPWLMIFGVAARPDCRGKGYPSRLMEQAIAEAKAAKRAGVVLTCKEALLPYYARFGFQNEGPSASAHGGAVWYQMRLTF